MRDVNAAYHLGANSFLVKPMDFEDVVHLSKAFTSYWLQLNKAPDTFRQDRKRQQSPGTWWLKAGT